MKDAFSNQVNRLEQSNYPCKILAFLSERVSGKLKSEGRGDAIREAHVKDRPVVSIPYVHASSHRMKKVGSRFEIDVVFSAKNKLGRICAAVESWGWQEKMEWVWS